MQSPLLLTQHCAKLFANKNNTVILYFMFKLRQFQHTVINIGTQSRKMNAKKLNFPKLLATGSQKNSTASSHPSSQSSQESASQASANSPYFSPRRTRNQIKPKYEADAAIQKTDTLKSKPQKSNTDSLKLAKTKRSDLQKNTAAKLEPKLEPAEPEDSPSDSQSSSPRKLAKWQPANWQLTLAAIQRMRDAQSAPVDTMGCHMCYDRDADEKTKRFQILVALMLSSQTKDQVTYQAMQRLIDDGLTPEMVVEQSAEHLELRLYPVSFYKNKVKFVQKTARILIDDYESDIPPTFAEMIKLPGVGPKMAHICMSAAWHQITGIGVDTHVHRITNRLRWTQKPTADPERTRAALEQWLPERLWAEINPLLVGFGQTICTPTNPKCGQCENAEWCPSRGVKQ